MNITSETPVREIAVAFPTAIPVLERFRIDYCCGGQHTLGVACTKHGQDINPVLAELKEQQHKLACSETDWQTATLTQLIEHIVHKHHDFTREQLALIRDLAAKVERRHGDHHPEAFRVSTAISSVTAELTHHFFCEESTLFPYLAQLEAEGTAPLSPMFGSVEQPITRMMMEHDQTGSELRLLREITHDYRLPDDACTTYRALYRALEDLEQDLHQHIHLENNILFPRALAATKKHQ
jgi:regulator of cell morphogenesis and NO signaling